ncbi:MAG TPA: lipase maturation factor family protein, partial [Opitutaceae bacterium]|nr:lipase maturation factor family protein [Opitutaceae bacterium]
PWSLFPFWRPQEPPRFARLLLWWLLFRLMFFAGVVKLASGDPLWRNLTALAVHYETQPLPTPLAWYSHQLPAWWHRAACAGMFAVELLVPFFLFAPRALRHNAALILAAFMASVALTGNYTFFNFLAIALCLLCLDDAWWRRLLPSRIRNQFHVIRETNPRPKLTLRRQAGMAAAGMVFAYTGAQSLPVLFPWLGAPPGFGLAYGLVAPFRSFNNYGLFAVMTNPRAELIFEGSEDGREWRAYEFPHKPGALERRPTWVAPHQPRLDWQLWFAALGAPQQNQWVLGVCEHLLRGTPGVLALLSHNPFPGKPPRHIRVVRYEYHFTDAATRSRTGQWWRRTPLDFYVPPASLK